MALRTRLGGTDRAHLFLTSETSENSEGSEGPARLQNENSLTVLDSGFGFCQDTANTKRKPQGCFMMPLKWGVAPECGL